MRAAQNRCCGHLPWLGPGRISDEGRAELDEDELTPAQVELDGELGLMVDGGRSMVDIHGC